MKKILFKIGGFFKKMKPSKRKIVQLYAALLYNANLKGFIKGEIFTGKSKVACVPGLNCYSCPGAIGACPLGSLQGAISNSNKSLPYYVVGILLLYGLILGRTICGWLCPVGLTQELAYKIKSKKLKKNKFTRLLSYFKYVILIIFVIIIPLAYSKVAISTPAFCKYICPAGIFEGSFFLLSNSNNEGFFTMLGPIFTWKFFVFIVLFVTCIFVYRAFCRFICPLGAIYGLFNKFSLLGVKVNNDTCTNCGLCVKECKMDIKKVGDHECINCGECINVCPTKAIQWKGKKFELPKNEIDNINLEDKNVNQKEAKKIKNFKLFTQIGSLLLLVGVLIYAYFGDNKAKHSEFAQEGYLCENFKITSLNSKEEFEIEVDTKNKVTYLNFWYIKCGSCVAELPHFEEFYQEYQENVNVVAINPVDKKEDIDEFLYEMEWDLYGLNFGIPQDDIDLEAYFKINNAYPFTAIIDKDGVIQKLHFGSMEKEQLIAYYNEYK